MNEIAKAHWDLSMQWIKAADDAEDVNTTICYTNMAEFALKAARFAAEYPALVAGIDEMAPPMPNANSPVPHQPPQGPKFWGAPSA